MNTQQVLKTLKQGNQRFLKAIKNDNALEIPVSTLPSATIQRPSAVIVSCSDSRVPPELIFSCGLGEIFVVRVAGNVVTPSQMASIEFACQTFGTRLVVVLGHTNCGAIKACVSAMISNTDKDATPEKNKQDINNIDTVMQEIEPAIRATLDKGENLHSEHFCARVEETNIQIVSKNIASRSLILESMHDLKIVGAQYDLASGEVKFYG